MLDIIIAAAALTLPSGDRRTARDLLNGLPEVSLEETTVASVEIWTDAEGRATHCAVIAAVGTPEITAQLCDSVIGSRFRPARDHEGNNVHGTHITRLSVFPDRAEQTRDIVEGFLEPTPRTPLLTLSVADLPDVLSEDPEIPIRILVDGTGKLEYCEVTEEKFLPFADMVCGHAQGVQFSVRIDGDEAPVRYIASEVIAFEVDIGGG